MLEYSLEELLEREPVVIDNENISSYINNKNVLVTGARFYRFGNL